MNRRWVIVSAVWMASLLAGVVVFFSIPIIATPELRTVDFEWYSFFDVPMIRDVWERREFVYGEDHVISWTYPVVYIWEPKPKQSWYYTSARLKVTARNLPEININKLNGTRGAGFLPLYLMNSTPIAVPAGGTAEISWYMQYIGEERAEQLGIMGALLEGWETELNGTITMDKAAATKVLGINETQFLDIENWWATNEADVEDAWIDWLSAEGSIDGRVDIRPFYDYPFERLAFDLALAHVAADKITITIDLASWGMECLLARWFQETYMPGYEGYYSDLHLNATVGPTTSHVDLDTAVDWALCLWSAEDVPYADSVWAWEPLLGDIPELAHRYDTSTSPAYPYYEKTYSIFAPGHPLYSDSLGYDYTPVAWDLKEGEKLKFSFKDIDEKGPVWVLTQKPWNPETQTPADAVVNATGYLELGYMEPWGNASQHYSEHISYDQATKTITLTGPINAETWLKSTFPEEWNRLDGLLPWGCPYIEFKVVPTTVSVSPSKIVGPPPDVGEQFTVNITVSSVGGIYSWQAGMVFDASVLQCVSFDEGPFLATGGNTTWTPGAIENTTGTITPYNCTLTAGTPMNGTGTLAKVTFSVVGYGSTFLNLTKVKLLSPDLTEITIGMIHNGTVTVTAAYMLPTELIVGIGVAVVVIIAATLYVVKRRKSPP